MSEYLSDIARLSPKQRFHMMDLGMNPLNPDHIKSYLNGKVAKVSLEENIERIKAIVGDDVFNKNLGHGKEREGGMPTPGQEYVPRDIDSLSAPSPKRDFREELRRDMDEYASATPSRTISGDDLLSLSRPQNNRMNNKEQLNEAAKTGRSAATTYYNTFIKSLQNPNTQSHFAVYKALKLMLEQEKNLQGTNDLKYYQQGVNEVASKMYSKLTNQLND